MTVDASPNGGIAVEGEARANILVRAEVHAQAASLEEARAMAGRVEVTATADRVSASGPDRTGRNEGWSVSYRLTVPTGTPLSLHTTNGGVSIDNVQSHVNFKTTNGGVTLKRMGGDVEGSTSNGGVTVALDGATWNGSGLDVQTTNGGVTLAIPEGYSAHLETGTRNGGMNIDFPMTVQGTIEPHPLNGSGKRWADGAGQDVQRRNQDRAEVSWRRFAARYPLTAHRCPLTATR